MKLAISFSGEGRGHTSRIGALAKELQKKHELYFWCPYTVQQFFKSMHPNAKIRTVPYIQLVKKNHRIQVYTTFKKNFSFIFRSQKHVEEIARKLLELDIDLVIADYEPFLPKAAKKAGIPVVLFNHQGVINRFPSLRIDAIVARIANMVMMPKADHTIISSFYGGDVGPLIRQEVKSVEIRKDDFILVYMKESWKDKILPLLRHSDVKFRCFPDEKQDFVEALAGCKGVIAPAGHQLISECIVLKKPILAIPEALQYEQYLNAKMVGETGWGIRCDPNTMGECLEEFIELLHRFPLKPASKNVKFILQDDTPNAVKKIEDVMDRLVKNAICKTSE